ncbi:hypothetical protein GP486_003693 [Trichoglossum hirsutum]|uniref:tRNA dimethylallyltransferase n=1 Tax=Trichoglossum hirsutum TaxID=265104 RepID=A0A9P8LCE4_9PEZI|nr:hypothetical protein GP486_003693 [Trichoglossum hirsutum]
MTRKPPPNPLITVLGATGTGKSKLAVELAAKLNGEIINGDAMQMYEGLDIITNKISPDERKGVRHHLLGCIGLDDEAWTVAKFTQKALGIIKEIRSRGRVPILVGGTHYYVQSLLFRESLIDTESPIDKANSTANPAGSYEKFNDPILQAPTPDILERLREVDPVMADRWHPNDRRRIQRSLEIYLTTGARASDIYEEQSHRRNIGSNNIEDKDNDQYPPNSGGDIVLEGRGASDIGVLEAPSRNRFQSLVFWIHAEHKILKPRLDNRVEQMVNDGLLSEVESLQGYLESQADHGKVVDQTRGIWVSIGYKEFSSYLAALASGNASEKELKSLEQEAIEQTKAATRQYAKRQVRWIRIKLINAASVAGIIGNVFPLDGNDLTQWTDNVELPALNVAKDFLAGEPLPDPAEMSPTAQEMLVPKRDYDLSDRRDLWVKRTCDYCGKVTVTERDWERHVKSRAHRAAARKGVMMMMMTAGTPAAPETR